MRARSEGDARRRAGSPGAGDKLNSAPGATIVSEKVGCGAVRAARFAVRAGERELKIPHNCMTAAAFAPSAVRVAPHAARLWQCGTDSRAAAATR